MNREVPILFSAPMVRAILAGKTQTRRIIKPQPGGHTAWKDEDSGLWFTSGHGEAGDWNVPLRWQPGDRLWVKETFRGAAGYDHQPPRDWGNKPIWYCADGEPPASGSWWFLSNRARSPLHMPRWASRIDLLVTDVCVQRLRDITEDDAKAEGAPATLVPPDGGSAPHTAGFIEIWGKINGAGSWDANPWVAAITFERIRP
jgi:hypothetical protein